jgi:hypothetical protein
MAGDFIDLRLVGPCSRRTLNRFRLAHDNGYYYALLWG